MNRIIERREPLGSALGGEPAKGKRTYFRKSCVARVTTLCVLSILFV